MIATLLSNDYSPGGGTHILGHGRGSAVITPVFEIFNPIGSIFYTSTQCD